MGASEATSTALKKLYQERLSAWKRANGTTVEQLAERCGVTASYLGQISRYGRIPGKPVLLLLAMNLDRHNPERWFAAANIETDWPYAKGLGLAQVENQDQGFLSVSVDMSRFEETIERIVTKASRTRSISELTQGRALRVGMDLGSTWAFQQYLDGIPNEDVGFFPALIRTLAISLQSRISVVPCAHGDFLERMTNGELDLFGPMFSQPGRLGDSVLAVPYCSVGLSAVWRKGAHPRLEELPIPTKLDELRDSRYHIAVIRDGISNHFANARLGRTDNLYLCESHEEREERLVLSGISRPAHVVLCDSIVAHTVAQRHPEQCEVLVLDGSAVLDRYQHSIAVRRDWPELHGLIDDSIRFLARGKATEEMFWESIPRDVKEYVSFSLNH